MRISGFTIIKNAVINDYPVVEAINSILPVVDEMIVLIGDSTDATVELIKSIQDSKIKIHHSVWDHSLRKDGEVLAVETNKAFQLIDPASTWAFYIQADEAVHEKDHAAILESCKRYKDDQRVQGLLFKYIHFYGTYDYVGDSRKWYNHEVRIIRNDKKISSYKDAQGFRIGKEKIAVRESNANIYHYGWVKNPEQMKSKIHEVSRYWDANIPDKEAYKKSIDIFDYSSFDSLSAFKGSHPAVMHRRITEKNWHLQFDLSKKKLSWKDRILYRFEKFTGIRPFEFKNYKVIR